MTLLKGKRIVIVLKGLGLGGAERQALLLARHLAFEQGTEVQIWGLGKEPGRVSELCQEYGIPWKILPVRLHRKKLKLVRDLLRFTWALRRARPDVIMPYLDVPNIACGLVWRWTGARLCIWNQRELTLHHMNRRVAKIAIRSTPRFVSNSQVGADLLVQSLGVNPELVHLIHNGVELATPQLDRAGWRAQVGADENCFTVCMVANITKLKDHVTLLRAWPRVIQELGKVGREAALLLAGGFYDAYDSIKALASDLRINGSVRFLWPVKDVSGLLRAADLGVLSSRAEACPNAILEYMATGLAVVGTNNSGIREAVGPDGYPFLVPHGDPEALADRIIELAMDSDLRARLGVLNRHRVEKEFSPQQLYAQTVALIAEGLGISSF